MADGPGAFGSPVNVSVRGGRVSYSTPEGVPVAEAWVSGEDDPFERSVDDLYLEAMSLLLKKHKDYGPKNIAGAPGGPLNGLRVRMWDKLARINNLIDSGAEPNNESLRDSFVDLANYALIACLVLDNAWPNE